MPPPKGGASRESADKLVKILCRDTEASGRLRALLTWSKKLEKQHPASKPHNHAELPTSDTRELVDPGVREFILKCPDCSVNHIRQMLWEFLKVDVEFSHITRVRNGFK